MFAGGAALMIGTVLIATARMWHRPSETGPESTNRGEPGANE
jgi:hypothetical protein